MKFMHPSGTVIDTARQDGDAQFGLAPTFETNG